MNSEDVKQYTKSISILYVDKDEEQDKEINELLNEFFAKVDIYDNSETALDVYKTKKYDIIFIGLDIESIHALDFIKGIRAIHSYQHVVVASSSADVNTVLSLINIGIDKFVPKPYTKKKVLSVLYGISTEILMSNEIYDNNKKTTHIATEYKKILDTVSNGIIIIENSNIIDTNRFTLKIMGVDSIFGLENLVHNIKDILIKADGYLCPSSLNDLIDMTKDSGNFHRILIKGNMDNKVIMFTTHTLEQNKRYVISLSDVTALDNVDRYNQLTKLPNQVDFIDKINRFRTTDYELMLISISNYLSIVKWHGKTAGFEVEKKVADTLISATKTLNIDEKTYISNIDKNQYAVFVQKEHTKDFVKEVSKLSDMSSLRLDSNSEKKEIKFIIWHKGIEFASIEINELLVIMNDEYDLALK